MERIFVQFNDPFEKGGKWKGKAELSDHGSSRSRIEALLCSNRPRWRVYIDSVYRPPWRARVCVNGSNIGLAFVPFVCLGPALSGIDLDRGQPPRDSLRRIL